MKNKEIVAVEFVNVTFGYTPKMTTLDKLSFKFFDNEYICIVGHNGSGKSTISKVITGLVEPRSGCVKIFDEVVDVNNKRFICDNVGIIFQNPDNQFIGITPEDDIAFGLENRKVDPQDIGDIIKQVSKLMNIEDILEKEASMLSGGQKQRVAISSILAINPKIIIFDESTSMLDPKAKSELKKLMLVLKEKFGKTIISITHDMEEIINADRVLVMEGGKLLQFGTPSEIFEDREKLQKNKLDFPLSLQISSLLSKKYNNFPLIIDYDELVSEIVKLGEKNA
ncbi:MAG: ATP-binding cassette domain-containing protein [Mycoplasmataceae bacterium]|jgi:energy-coupling factor transport system ATP-binding protein|nr:ATP-binding cassette domain-containing protein [Mycoplasmataceae bacterium]